MKRRLLLLAMSAGMLTSVSAQQAPNLGTAKADNVQLYAQSDDKANLDAPVNAQLNYRIVDDGTYFWAHYTIVPTNETETTIENAAWAAQLRNWGRRPKDSLFTQRRKNRCKLLRADKQQRNYRQFNCTIASISFSTERNRLVCYRTYQLYSWQH